MAVERDWANGEVLLPHRRRAHANEEGTGKLEPSFGRDQSGGARDLRCARSAKSVCGSARCSGGALWNSNWTPNLAFIWNSRSKRTWSPAWRPAKPAGLRCEQSEALHNIRRNAAICAV